MTNFTKIVHVGTGERGRVFCKITYEELSLSITGVEGPRVNGNAGGSHGQIIMQDWNLTTYASGWSSELEQAFRAIWEKWHLNDMQAGSPAQRAFLEANPVQHTYPESHYTKALAALQAAGLSPDPHYTHNGKPYAYGSAWLKKSVPAEVLDFLRALPDTRVKPAWV